MGRVRLAERRGAVRPGSFANAFGGVVGPDCFPAGAVRPGPGERAREAPVRAADVEPRREVRVPEEGPPGRGAPRAADPGRGDRADGGRREGRGAARGSPSRRARAEGRADEGGPGGDGDLKGVTSQ